jgi:hypothetical protein
MDDIVLKEAATIERRLRRITDEYAGDLAKRCHAPLAPRCGISWMTRHIRPREKATVSRSIEA